MDAVVLRNVKQEKDIGVIVDEQLKFEDHMYEKIKKANNVMGLIRRSFIHMDEEMFLKLYKALVRAHLEYAKCYLASNQNKRYNSNRKCPKTSY